MGGFGTLSLQTLYFEKSVRLREEQYDNTQTHPLLHSLTLTTALSSFGLVLKHDYLCITAKSILEISNIC